MRAMSVDLREPKGLGSLGDLLLILRVLRASGKVPSTDLEQYCRNSKDFSRISPRGPLCTLRYVEAITESESFISLTQFGSNLAEYPDEDARIELARRFLVKAKEDSSLDPISNMRVELDPEEERLVVHNSSIPLSHSGVKNLLLELGILNWCPKTYGNFLGVSTQFDDLFSELVEKGRNRVTQEELLMRLERQRKQGDLAEAFVLELERRRMALHPRKERIRLISKLDVGAGYDILSFEATGSTRLDRHIEVKSYSGRLQFFWSRTEIETAKRIGNGYYLYLVDMKRINHKGFMPIMIRNPYKEVFCCDLWKQEWETMHFKPLEGALNWADVAQLSPCSERLMK